MGGGGFFFKLNTNFIYAVSTSLLTGVELTRLPKAILKFSSSEKGNQGLN